jgi:hypothetical protein
MTPQEHSSTSRSHKLIVESNNIRRTNPTKEQDSKKYHNDTYKEDRIDDSDNIDGGESIDSEDNIDNRI